MRGLSHLALLRTLARDVAALSVSGYVVLQIIVAAYWLIWRQPFSVLQSSIVDGAFVAFALVPVPTSSSAGPSRSSSGVAQIGLRRKNCQPRIGKCQPTHSHSPNRRYRTGACRS